MSQARRQLTKGKKEKSGDTKIIIYLSIPFFFFLLNTHLFFSPVKSSFKAVSLQLYEKTHNAFNSIIQIQNVFKFPSFVAFEIDSSIIRDNKEEGN